jgi:hypothetical protein
MNDTHPVRIPSQGAAGQDDDQVLQDSLRQRWRSWSPAPLCLQQLRWGALCQGMAGYRRITSGLSPKLGDILGELGDSGAIGPFRWYTPSADLAQG